ncbi:hypothetical protein GMOD_00000546 [Pyrenophora seminiperda CCB06]|uniref:Uncharacterized protein n=1 Tax=Pyrenophora seminiperda CCB06 TaxID=1302712 RepID=A0A3M7M7K6_9PLEO|nr:hypothetical protein GMOD_00000546 [Pyrenophora seminiperda CCB06]
MQQFLVSGLV